MTSIGPGSVEEGFARKAAAPRSLVGRLARNGGDLCWSAFFRLVGVAIPVGYAAILLLEAASGRSAERSDAAEPGLVPGDDLAKDDFKGPRGVV